MPLQFPIGESRKVTLSALTDVATGSQVNNATVTYVIKGPTGATLSSGSYTAAGAGGNYTATIPAGVTALFTSGARHLFVTTAASGTAVRISTDVFYPTTESLAS